VCRYRSELASVTAPCPVAGVVTAQGSHRSRSPGVPTMELLQMTSFAAPAAAARLLVPHATTTRRTATTSSFAAGRSPTPYVRAAASSSSGDSPSASPSRAVRFRPCIDIHQGRVKQIVGGTLVDSTDGVAGRVLHSSPDFLLVVHLYTTAAAAAAAALLVAAARGFATRPRFQKALELYCP